MHELGIRRIRVDREERADRRVQIRAQQPIGYVKGLQPLAFGIKRPTLSLTRRGRSLEEKSLPP